ncbi:MAG: hypothetical protein DRO12_04365 [Thermoprotei archaeon]|nr:MAG: hypothetical protein DRO12_04365 [Thermoprotei archaeon]
MLLLEKHFNIGLFFFNMCKRGCVKALEEEKDGFIAFRIPQKYQERLREIAKSSGRSVSALMRDIVVQLLNEESQKQENQRWQPAVFWVKRIGQLLQEVQARMIILQETLLQIRDQLNGGQ